MSFLFVLFSSFFVLLWASCATGVSTGPVGWVAGAKKGVFEIKPSEGTFITKVLGVEKMLPLLSKASIPQHIGREAIQPPGK